MTFESGAAKRRYVQDMFGRIAGRYDLMNRFMTIGQDGRWRQALVAAAAVPPGGRLLDIATGTGDVAFAALRGANAPGLIVGADFTLPMLRLAQQRAARQPSLQTWRLHWTAGDTLSLPFASDTFDATASAFLMRNVTDVAQALREQLRVVRPGGRVVILDIPRPGDRTWHHRLSRVYFRRVVPVLGMMLAGHRDAYKYLPVSAESFLTPDELASIMEKSGCAQVSYRLFMMGTVALHVGRRP
jgi:demethylmenaquinone methyltransferase/2-methoxy-6-polyprenyl-1,4-benzoquinol methylase